VTISDYDESIIELKFCVRRLFDVLTDKEILDYIDILFGDIENKSSFWEDKFESEKNNLYNNKHGYKINISSHRNYIMRLGYSIRKLLCEYTLTKTDIVRFVNDEIRNWYDLKENLIQCRG
jgi:hypothetical protein